MLTTFPQCNFSLGFPEILSQNLIRRHLLSVLGNSKTMHYGILINTPYLDSPRLTDVGIVDAAGVVLLVSNSKSSSTDRPTGL